MTTTTMKSTKQVKKKSFVSDSFSPGLKKKEKTKYEAQPMVLMTSEAPENIAQYSMDIPSANKNAVLDEMDMLKNITVHLNQVGYSFYFSIFIQFCSSYFIISFYSYIKRAI